MAWRLEEAKERLQTLLAGLPRDPLTLASIQHAAARVERSAATLPAIVKGAIDHLSKQAAQGLASAVGPQGDRFIRAARAVDQAAAN